LVPRGFAAAGIAMTAAVATAKSANTTSLRIAVILIAPP
jgi:predicted phosphoribosyltransferase